MVTLISFGKNTHALRLGFRAAFCASLTVLGAGCASLENEEGRLPDAMRAAMTSLSSKGYPDLTKLPDAPTDMPSAATWTALETGLRAQGQQVAANPAATAPTPDETNVNWAQSVRASLEADPMAQPVPAAKAGVQTELEAAAAARAKFDADLARLPPL
jgi:hypothetical protein